MTNDADQILSDLLKRWYWHEDAYRFGRGHPKVSMTCADYRPSRQHDAENGALDMAQEDEKMETITFEVDQIEDAQQRYGIRLNAKALALGWSVFRHPRMPEDRVECLKIIAAGRAELSRRLLMRGVM